MDYNSKKVFYYNMHKLDALTMQLFESLKRQGLTPAERVRWLEQSDAAGNGWTP